MLTFIFRSTCCPGVFWVFQFLGRTFQLKVLPFGLKVFPWVFTRVVATLVGHLRQLGLRLFYYLDVWLLVAESRDLLEFLLRTTLLWSRDLGFLVNWVKFFPLSTETSFLSWGSFRHPKVVGSAFRAQSFGSSGVFQDLSKGPLAPALFWQKFFGHLAGFVDLVPYCRLLMRPLQLHLLRDFTPLIDSQDLLVPLSSEFKVLCVAWSSPSRLLEGKLFAALPPSLVITTDASGQGWGAVLHPHRVSGVWSKEEVFDHINTLELKAVLLALQNLESLVVGHSLLIRSGYMTVVSFIIFQGGILSLSLCRLALDLWEWCLRRRIFLHAAHIPGEEYFVADFLSRG